MQRATIIITPRDRYSGIVECIETVYQHTNPAQFDLVILDLGYPPNIRAEIDQCIATRGNASVESLGLIIPMKALDSIRAKLSTPYTVLLDNDSRVTDGWLEPLISTADETQAAVVYPLILEKAGVDKGADLRNHLFTTEFKVIDYENEPFLIEHKTFRRTLPEDLPTAVTESEAFELHCVMFRTTELQSLEIPHATIREHLDIGMQLKAQGKKIFVVPQSIVKFDNLGTRANLYDLRYFNLRWNSRVTEASSRLFEKRWGYRFYSEQSIYNWAFRRRLFLILRWLHLPVGMANSIDRIVFAVKRRLFPIWDPIPDAEERSTSFYARFSNAAPPQINHSTQ